MSVIYGKPVNVGGGSKIPQNLPPLNPNFSVKRTGGSITAKADKLLVGSDTSMLAGGVWVYKANGIPQNPKDGTVKKWTREELTTVFKYDGMYLGDVTASDAVNEVLLWLPEKIGGKTVLSPFIILSTDYLGGVYLLRKETVPDITVGKWNAAYYDGSILDTTITGTYLNSILDKSVTDKLVVCDLPIQGASSQYETTVKIRRKAWALSYSECYAGTVDGTKMAYFTGNPRRATNTQYWLRSRGDGYGVNNIRYVDTSGTVNIVGSSNYSFRIRPAFVLPKDFKIQQRPDGSYTVYNNYGLMTLKDIKVSDSSSVTKIHVRENSGVYIFDYVSSNYNDSDRGCLFREEALAGTVGTSVTYPSGGAGQGASNWEAALPSSLRNLISEVTIKYKNATSVQETTARAFVPSIDEMYGTETNYGTGTQWNMMKVSANRIRHYNGSPISYWLRDAASSTKVNYMYTSGNYNSDGVNSQKYCVPAFTLPLTAPIRQLADGTYDLVPDDPALSQPATIADDSPLEWTFQFPETIPCYVRQYTYNEKGQYQTMLQGAVASTEGKPPFALPEFTGNHAIFGDETAGRIELYESGTLTLYPGTYDLFLVGGGASGGNTTDTSVQEHTGGGGGGYTTTISDIVVSKRSEFIATVGAGGNRSAGSQTIFENGSTTIKYTANGGAMVTGGYTANGGAGGSGGGGFNRDNGNGYAGGSDGSNGLGRTGGIGQGTTTRMFGEAGNTLFSGGGGGAGDGRGYYPGAGGAGGGGAAGNNVNGVAGTANTGGGGGGYSTVNTGARLQPGAGGSGIIIVRWNNA